MSSDRTKETVLGEWNIAELKQAVIEDKQDGNYSTLQPDLVLALIECAEALKQMRATVKAVPEMNHMRFDGVGIRVFNALNAIGEA